MKATRRDFLKAATVTSGVLMTGSSIFANNDEKPEPPKPIGIALQLFSVRDDCARDIPLPIVKTKNRFF